MRRKGPSSAQGEIVYRGKTLLNPTLAIGSNVTSLTPNGLNSVNLGSLSDTFQHYRFEDLRVTLYPGSSDTYMVTYYDELSDAPGTTLTGQGYQPYSALMTDGVFTPKSFRVPKQMLLGQNALNWWRTRSTSGSSTNLWEQIQGSLNFIADAAISVFVSISYVVRFANAVTTAMTPMIYKRPSLVKPEWSSLPIIDLYLPFEPHPFPDGLEFERESARSLALYRIKYPFVRRRVELRSFQPF